MKYIEQNGSTELDGTLIKEQLVRADTLPLVMPVMGADGWPRGAQARVRLGRSDLLALDVSATVIARLDNPEDTHDDRQVDPEEDESALAVAVALAIDVSETEATPTTPTP